MARHHEEAVLAMAPGAAGKVSLLDPDREINDPAGGSMHDYEQVAAVIHRALQTRVTEVSMQP